MIGDLLICIFKMAAQREFGFFSMLFNGAYASKFETRWEP
jgi:hypothetical protein